MNLVEKLLKVDAKKANELETVTMKSKRLARIMEETEAVITLKEVPARRMNDIMATQYDKKGRFDMSAAFDAKALCVAESVIDPNLRDPNLMQHFACQTPKDLAIKLFGSEVSEISDQIARLSGVAEEDDDEETIKN